MALTPKVKLQTLINFPATAIGRTGINIINQSGNFYVDLAYSDFVPPVSPIPDIANQTVLLWDSVTGSYVLTPLSTLITSGPWVAYTPVLASEAGGALGSGNTLTGFYRQAGKTVSVRINIVMGASGIGSATQISVSLPATAVSDAILVARNRTSGIGGVADIGVLTLAKALLQTSGGGTLGGNGATMIVSGIYEAA